MELKVTQYGEPVLRKPGRRAESFDEALRSLAADMVETMYAHEGIGLAAQQVGQDIQLCVIDTQLPDAEADFRPTLDGKALPPTLLMPLVLVNPEVEVVPGPPVTMEEGCLSFPGIRGDIQRSGHVLTRYQDLSGVSHVLDAQGLLARVIQHEVDHLNGILFIDRMEPRLLRGLQGRLKRLKREARNPGIAAG